MSNPRGRPPQSHCKYGHSMEDAYVFKNGRRRCRTCSKEHDHKSYIPRPRPKPRVSSEVSALAYAAGLFDGEGCVQIRMQRKSKDKVAKYHQVNISITSTEMILMDWLVEHFGGSVNPNHKKNVKRNYKDAWKWQLLSRHADAFLKAIMPYMRFKRRQAEIAIELQATMGRGSTPLSAELVARREALRQELKSLNRRGRPSADTLPTMEDSYA